MPRQLFLHIGTTKTGSTSIQSVLHGARGVLTKHGVYYPETDLEFRHSVLAAKFTSTPAVLRDMRSPMWQGRDPHQALADYSQRFEAEMQGLPPEIDRVIISAEQFSRWVRKPADIARLHALLSRFFDDIAVVLYIRRQDAHFASQHAQSLRTGNFAPPDLHNLQDWLHDYDYNDLVGRWAAAFGESAMRPRIFERLPGKNFDVVSDFLGVCEISLPAATLQSHRRYNPSMSLTGQRILISIGQLMRGANKDRDLQSMMAWQRITRAVSTALPGAGWQPTRAQAAAFMQRYTETNEAVRRKWFPERSTLFSTGFDHLPETPPAIEPETDFNSACAVILEFANDVVQRERQLVKAKAQQASKADDPAQHREALRKAILLDGADIGARVRLSRLQIEDGSFQAARHNLTQAPKHDPNHQIAGRLLRRVARLIRESKSINAA